VTDYTFAERLRLYRAAAKVTQIDLAAAVGRSRQTVINWERGDYLPDRETVKEIARHLGLSEEDWDALLVLAGHPPYFGKLPGTAPEELLKAYQRYVASIELVRDYGPPCSTTIRITH